MFPCASFFNLYGALGDQSRIGIVHAARKLCTLKCQVPYRKRRDKGPGTYIHPVREMAEFRLGEFQEALLRLTYLPI